LPADARVTDFPRCWAELLARRGPRTDQITLRIKRAEIGNCLGMTLKSVSRALPKLACENVISFPEKKGAPRRPDSGSARTGDFR